MAKQKEYRDPAIAKRLARFRTDYIKKSQNKTAQMLGVDQSYISRMESGESAIGADFLMSLKDVFSLNVDWLIKEEGKPVINQEPVKGNLITDIGKLMTELNHLRKLIQIAEANQNHLINLMKGMEKRNDELEKRVAFLEKK